MADWTAQVFQNEYLPEGATDIHAIVTVTSHGTGHAGESGGAAEAIIIDCSGSMGAPQSKIIAARQAAAAAIDEIADETWFAVIAGVGLAQPVYPASGMVQADGRTRAVAKDAVSRLTPQGGTAIGQWLLTAYEHFQAAPATQRHAILLTDGKNEGETAKRLRTAVETVTGEFQCDCRGVADAKLKVWAPQGAELLFVRQVAPTIEDLTDRRVNVTPLITEYPTGAWGDESRDYHVAVRVQAKPIGAEQLVARVQIEVAGQVVTQALVKALWSDQTELTTRINPAVAHYTGQAELAEVIQEGLAAKAAGDTDTATFKLGRAAQLAAETGNEEATQRLAKVVDIEDAGTGTVRLKRDASKLDEMALDTSSTKTSRVRPS